MSEVEIEPRGMLYRLNQIIVSQILMEDEVIAQLGDLANDIKLHRTTSLSYTCPPKMTGLSCTFKCGFLLWPNLGTGRSGSSTLSGQISCLPILTSIGTSSCITKFFIILCRVCFLMLEVKIVWSCRQWKHLQQNTF